MDAAGAGDQADARLGQAEAGAVGGDHDVAGQRDLEAAAGRHAVDGGDQRLGAVVAARDRREARARSDALLAVGRRLGRRLEVVAGAERPVAGAGDDRHPGVVVALEVVEDLDQLGVRVRVQRVHPLGPVERHVRDVAALLVDDVVVAHGAGRNFGIGDVSLTRSKTTSSAIPISQRVVRAADDLAGQADALLGLDDGDVVGDVGGERLVVELVHDHEAVERRPAAGGRPLEVAGEAARRSAAAPARRCRRWAT